MCTFYKLIKKLRFLDLVAILYFALMLNNIANNDYGWIPINLIILGGYIYARFLQLTKK